MSLRIQRHTMVRVALLFVLGLSGLLPVLGQGIQPFSTQASGPYSNVDLSTTNILFSIPIRSKIGAVPFQYSLVANSDPHAGFAVNGGFKGTLTGPSGVLSAGLVPGIHSISGLR